MEFEEVRQLLQYKYDSPICKFAVWKEISFENKLQVAQEIGAFLDADERKILADKKRMKRLKFDISAEDLTDENYIVWASEGWYN